MIYLNTSHVNVNPYNNIKTVGLDTYLNTSHVNVNLL